MFDLNLIYSLGHYVYYTSCIVFTAQNNFFWNINFFRTKQFFLNINFFRRLILCDTQITTKHLSSDERCREWMHLAKCFYVNESIDGYWVEKHVHFFLIFSYINSQYLFSFLIGKKTFIVWKKNNLLSVIKENRNIIVKNKKMSLYYGKKKKFRLANSNPGLSHMNPILVPLGYISICERQRIASPDQIWERILNKFLKRIESVL